MPSRAVNRKGVAAVSAIGIILAIAIISYSVAGDGTDAVPPAEVPEAPPPDPAGGQTAPPGTYVPTPPVWIGSGPFEIDKASYVLGEKIFVRVSGLAYDERGQMLFLRPINDTHHATYKTIDFDGSIKPAFNQYFDPELSRLNGICSADDLLGEWIVLFGNTQYQPLRFQITDAMVPGSEKYFEPVC